MSTRIIRDKIRQAINHEKRTQTLANIIMQGAIVMGRPLNNQQIDKIIKFVKDYINRVPELLEVAEQTSKQAGLYHQVSPILEIAIQYFHQDFDLIPDHMGLSGLLDDAYLANCLLQGVSDHYQQQTGTSLISTNATPANQMMRLIIGDPYISILDNAVFSSLQGPVIQQSLAALLGAGGIPMTWGDPVWSDTELQNQVDHNVGLLKTYL